jgi:DNA repair exonuclease SbcCD ATPase subunit
MDRESLKTEAQKAIDSIFANIDELEAKKDGVKAEVKAEYEKRLSELKAKKAELQDKYNKLAGASQDKLNEVQAAFSSAAGSFKEGISKLTSLFK